MTNRVTINSLLGLAIMLSLLAVAPSPSFAGCRNSGSSSGTSKFSSQVNGGSVTICASAVAVTPARSATVKTPIKVVAKTKALVSVPVRNALKKAAKPKVNAKITFHRMPAPKPKVMPKPVIKKKIVAKIISKPSTANKTSAAADFTPAAVNGNVYPSTELSLGQKATFVANAVQHYRAGTLLGLPTEVRFTPISVSWNFGDGNGGLGSYSAHAFTAPGSHLVQVQVVYSVSYRVKGNLVWVAEPDSITVADDLVVAVSAGAATGGTALEPTAANRVLLVGQNCLSNPGSFGCN